jgi:hypothetical protein
MQHFASVTYLWVLHNGLNSDIYHHASRNRHANTFPRQWGYTYEVEAC